MSNPSPLESSTASSPAVVWSCVTRDGVILVEAGEDAHGGAVRETAQQLLQRKSTPGWEFHRCRQYGRAVRGVKFHLYQYNTDDDVVVVNHRNHNSNLESKPNYSNNNLNNDSPNAVPLHTWVFACVYESNLPKIQAQSFLEKIVTITELPREIDHEWKYGDTLAAQRSFGPILYQRMQEVQSMGRLAMCHEQLDGIKQVMGKNIELLLERGERLESLEHKASTLQQAAAVFKKRARTLRRVKMWQDAKYGVVIGTVVVTSVAVVTVPTLIAAI